MLFWILAGVAVVLCAWGWWTWMNDHYSAPDTIFGAVMSGIAMLALAACGVGLSWVGSHALAASFNDGPRVASESERGLVALQTKDTEEGKFSGNIFASYGYVNGVRVLSYISQSEDGGLRTDYAKAGNSVVYQNDETPKVITYQWETSNGWLHPASINAGTTYAFTVPEGSVVDGYEVAP